MLALLAACGGRVASAGTDEPSTGTMAGGTTPAAGASSGSSAGAPSTSGGSGGSSAGSSGGSSGGSGSGGSGSGGSGSGGSATGTATCMDLPPWKLTSVDEARAALTLPFPNAWALCAGYTLYLCPKESPYVSFDATGTQVSCGNLYEGGFQATSTTPMSLTEDASGNVRLRWSIPDGSAEFFLSAFGDASGPRALSLSLSGDPPPPPALMIPAPPLP